MTNPPPHPPSPHTTTTAYNLFSLPFQPNPIVSVDQAVCVRVCVLPYFGPVVQRLLYLQSELSSITRPAPVTQRLLNGLPCSDKHTCSPAHAHIHTCLCMYTHKYSAQRAEAPWSAPRASPQRHACQQTGSDSTEPPEV